VLRADLLACLAFYTRLPFDGGDPAGRGFAAAQWAAPLAGLAVAMCGAAVLAVCDLAGLPVMLGALLAVAATMLASGALHEDGLADTADALGGKDIASRLAIMRDSRSGSYGVIALILSIGLRAVAIASLGGGAALFVLIGAHALSRGGLAAMLHALEPARRDGLGAAAGKPALDRTQMAVGLGAAILLVASLFASLPAGLLALVLAGIAGLALANLANSRFGGYTGDVLGALEQSIEIAVLLAFALWIGH
jgi:adenosylcobinamide-GDP ribazoletransferase